MKIEEEPGPHTREGEPISRGWIAFAVAAAVLLVALAWRTGPPPKPKADTSLPSGFSEVLCEDAWKTVADYRLERIAYFDVKLKPGCFSGKIGIPSIWTKWEVDMTSHGSDDWLACVFDGWPHPLWWTGAALNAGQAHFGNPPSLFFRAQGNGTVRFTELTTAGERAVVPPTDAEAKVNFNPRQVCQDAFDQVADYSQLSVSHVEVEAKEGCFGGWVILPESWGELWRPQVQGDAGPTGWMAFWFSGDPTGVGPFPTDGTPLHLEAHHSSKFRLQGNRTIIFYKTTP